MLLLEVEVTQDDIDKGLPGNPCQCAFSLACKRLWPDCYVQTNPVIVVLCRNPKHECAIVYSSGVDLINFIFRYDNKLPVQPQKFKILEKTYGN